MFFCTTLQINGGGSITPSFNGGLTSVQTAVSAPGAAAGSSIVQQLIIYTQTTDVSSGLRVISSVAVYYI